jgi:hypothetical protein
MTAIESFDFSFSGAAHFAMFAKYAGKLGRSGAAPF